MDLHRVLELRIMEHVKALDPLVNLVVKDIVRWKPPFVGCCKLNVDTAISVTDVSIAVLVRDCLGRILYARVKKVSTVDPTIAEAMAIY